MYKSKLAHVLLALFACVGPELLGGGSYIFPISKTIKHSEHWVS